MRERPLLAERLGRFWKAEGWLETDSREAEIARLSTCYGAPVRRQCVLQVGQEAYQWWSRVKRKRQGEVVLFIRRINGNLILHTKDFYPEGTLRVPSGGIKRKEPLLEAARRETFEETGLQVAIERFLAIVESEFCFQENSLLYSSYLFLLRELAGELRVMDTHERISAFVEVPPTELAAVARRLENMPPAWADWGRHRAFPHRLAAELLQASG